MTAGTARFVMGKTDTDSDFTFVESDDSSPSILSSIIKENQSLYRRLMSYIDTVIIIEINTKLSEYDLPQVQKNSFNVASRRELDSIYNDFFNLNLSDSDFEMMCYGVFESLMPMHRKIFENHVNQFATNDGTIQIVKEFESECRYQLRQIVSGYELFRL